MKKWGHLSSYHVCSRSYGIKMSKMAHFLYFLLMPAQKSHSLEKDLKDLSASEKSYLALYGLLHSELPLSKHQPLKI